MMEIILGVHLPNSADWDLRVGHNLTLVGVYKHYPVFSSNFLEKIPNIMNKTVVRYQLLYVEISQLWQNVWPIFITRYLLDFILSFNSYGVLQKNQTRV